MANSCKEPLSSYTPFPTVYFPPRQVTAAVAARLAGSAWLRVVESRLVQVKGKGLVTTHFVDRKADRVSPPVSAVEPEPSGASWRDSSAYEGVKRSGSAGIPIVNPVADIILAAASTPMRARTRRIFVPMSLGGDSGREGFLRPAGGSPRLTAKLPPPGDFQRVLSGRETSPSGLGGDGLLGELRFPDRSLSQPGISMAKRPSLPLTSSPTTHFGSDLALEVSRLHVAHTPARPRLLKSFSDAGGPGQQGDPCGRGPLGLSLGLRLSAGRLSDPAVHPLPLLPSVPPLHMPPPPPPPLGTVREEPKPPSPGDSMRVACVLPLPRAASFDAELCEAAEAAEANPAPGGAKGVRFSFANLKAAGRASPTGSALPSAASFDSDSELCDAAEAHPNAGGGKGVHFSFASGNFEAPPEDSTTRMLSRLSMSGPARFSTRRTLPRAAPSKLSRANLDILGVSVSRSAPPLMSASSVGFLSLPSADGSDSEVAGRLQIASANHTASGIDRFIAFFITSSESVDRAARFRFTLFMACFHLLVTGLTGVAIWYLSLDTPGPLRPPIDDREHIVQIGLVFLAVLVAMAVAQYISYARLMRAMDCTVAPAEGSDSASAPDASRVAAAPTLIAHRAFIFTVLLAQVGSTCMFSEFSRLLCMQRATITLTHVLIQTFATWIVLMQRADPGMIAAFIM